MEKWRIKEERGCGEKRDVDRLFALRIKCRNEDFVIKSQAR